jgi:hypothetical protein
VRLPDETVKRYFQYGTRRTQEFCPLRTFDTNSHLENSTTGVWFSSALCLVPRTAAGRPTDLPSNESAQSTCDASTPTVLSMRSDGGSTSTIRTGFGTVGVATAAPPASLAAHSDVLRHTPCRGAAKGWLAQLADSPVPSLPAPPPHLREEAATNTTAATTTAMLNMTVASSRRLPRRSHGRTATTRTTHDVP